MSSVKSVINQIKNQTDKMVDKSLEEKLQVFLDFFIFNLQTTRSENSIIKMFPINSFEFILMFLLRLKLYLKYEGKSLLISIFHFKVIQNILTPFLNKYAVLDNFSEEKTKIFALIMSVTSKIFIKDEVITSSAVPTIFNFDSIQTNLLFNLRDCSIFGLQRFWVAYYEYKLNKTQGFSNSQKLKILKIAETVMFYHFFISNDLEVSRNFVESCINQSLNLRLLKPIVKMKMGDLLYKIFSFYNQKYINKNYIYSYKEKLSRVLTLIISKRFVVSKDYKNWIFVDRYLSNTLLKNLLKIKLYQTKMNNEQRKVTWLKFIKINELYEIKSKKVTRQLSEGMYEQIQIDVIRTRQWKGSEYINNIKSILERFFESKPEKYEYFQGFNFIVSFLNEIYTTNSEVELVLEYFSKILFSVD